MFNKYKKIIEKIVDIKKYLNLILLNSLVILFPLNQQYRIRPFSSVDGFIIDYLMVKVSIPELILFAILLLNFKEIIKEIIRTDFYKFIALFSLFFLISIFKSNYLLLAFYENLVIAISLIVGFYFFRNIHVLNKNLLIWSVKFWIVFLSILGLAQFITQGSVFNNYPLTGEFPYTEDYYHIKQKNIFFENLIPPYTIFSHSNIFGGYIIFLFILLNTLEGFKKKYFLLTLGNLFLVGSVACFISFTLYLIALKLDRFRISILIKAVLYLSIAIHFIYSYRYPEFLGDYSIYRRLYMFDLSLNYFISNPWNFLFGSGYYNYFGIIKNDLFKYELVRFFQPPHFAFNLIIWQYGVIFLGFVFLVLFNTFSKINTHTLRILLVILVVFSFDHYLITSHQFKFLFLILFPYSLNIKNSIK
jgi:hypothetical protein